MNTLSGSYSINDIIIFIIVFFVERWLPFKDLAYNEASKLFILDIPKRFS